jgi:hypothetical protein
VYTGPVGSANLAEQIHDYNVHIDVNDVFWMIPVADDAVNVNFDQQQASLHVSGLRVFDDHDLANSLTQGLGLPGGLGFAYPKIPPVAPGRATVSFDVEWSSPTSIAQIHNDSQSFKGSFLQASATIKWSADQPGFHYESESPDPSRNLISVLGFEQNGVFFNLAA